MVCSIFLAALALLFHDVKGTALRSTFFDSKIVEAAQSEMRKECGSPCVTRFEGMLGWLEQNAAAVLTGNVTGPFNLTKRADGTPSNLAWLALANKEFGKARELSRTLERANATVGETDPLTRGTNHLQLKRKSRLFGGRGITDTPCADLGTCAMLEKGGQLCNYARVGTVTAYQAVNLALHVLMILGTLLCGALYVAFFYLAILKIITITCVLPVEDVFMSVTSINNGLWESAKGHTKKCIMHGYPLIQSLR